MLRQLVDKLPILILETEPVYLPIVEEVTKLICSYDNLTIVDLALSKLKAMKQQNRYFTEDLQTKDAIMREAIIV